ncbi:MAG: methylenetetrahydrofolate--tRNA-(uracil(54)-C(5))-methyltransferase (FADH(2)-oxidizing) TrmFO [Firmicutes bacterium]|nr:methylenetetrahydrofolate--tRNA-(uracil(54)-C(5))-methyltransferase (FADH(2)-oxidizing) TrmFO [Bacillota bacterium]
MNIRATIIGAGLAGAEASYQLAKRGVKVTLIDAKPKQRSPAHHSDNFCELVCSNSLKSLDICTAHGLLKAELEMLDSFILATAKKHAVPAGSALAVDREAFSKEITELLYNHPNIEIVNELVEEFPLDVPCIIATGPLTMGNLANKIKEEFAGNLYFYDAVAPIVSRESIDFDSAFVADRYGKSGDDGDPAYINCPMEKDEYLHFVSELLKAEKAPLHEFEKDIKVFEGCMPVEVLASRGVDTLRFGPLKPVGLVCPKTDRRPYAVVQLRQENASATMYNLVGFQTNLKFNEQKRVFGLIPALKEAEFLRYGVMHRNTFVNAPEVLNCDFSTKKYPNIYIAGQLSGVEGYLESVASGLLSAISLFNKFGRQNVVPTIFSLPPTTILGALTAYITTPNQNFQPMNANFGLLPPLLNSEKPKTKLKKLEHKNLKKQQLSDRAIDDFKKHLNNSL